MLADCLLHARALGAERLVDVATLTGGVVVALGSVYAGLFANDEELAGAGRDRGAVAPASRSGDCRSTRLRRDGRGRYAQLTNLTERREAQAITGGRVPSPLRRRRAVGPPRYRRDRLRRPPALPGGKGATGFGVRLLAELATLARAQASDPDHGEQTAQQANPAAPPGPGPRRPSPLRCGPSRRSAAAPRRSSGRPAVRSGPPSSPRTRRSGASAGASSTSTAPPSNTTRTGG